jgi:hypothetical protein
MPNHDGLFYTNGLSQILSLESDGTASQMFYIPEGWSGISSYVDPFISEVEVIFGIFGNNFTILSTTSGYYYPASGVNTIGLWNYQEGYTLKVEDDLTMTLEGIVADQMELSLNEGWNLLPVSVACEVSVIEVFGGIPEINIMKEVAGTRVYWPDFNVTSLADLAPGKAYWISVDESLSFTYPDCSETAFVPRPPDVIQNPTSWNDVQYTPESHLILFEGSVLEDANFQAGDVIGVFTLDGACAGFTELNEVNNLAVSAFADDELTPEKDGFNTWEPMKLKVFRPGKNEEILLDVEYDPAMSNQGSFTANGISSIIHASLVPNRIAEVPALDFSVYPNPSNGNFTLIFNDQVNGVNRIEILGISGNVLYAEFNISGNTKTYQMHLQELPEGIYFLKVYTESAIGYEKIIVQ